MNIAFTLHCEGRPCLWTSVVFVVAMEQQKKGMSMKTARASSFEYGDSMDQEHRAVRSASNVRIHLRCNCSWDHGCIPLPQTRFEKQTDTMLLKCKYKEESREKIPVCCYSVLCCVCSTFKIQFKVSVWLTSMYEPIQALKSPLVSYFISSEDLKKPYASPDCISPWMVWVQSLKM